MHIELGYNCSLTIIGGESRLNICTCGCSQFALKPVQVWMLSVWIVTSSSVDALSMDCNQFKFGCSQYGV